jgi:hypothetical protein
MGWILHQMNVNIVLINRVIEEEVYAEKPQGFEVYQKETLVETTSLWKILLPGWEGALICY